MKPTFRDVLLILAGLVVGALAIFGYGWLTTHSAAAAIEAPAVAAALDPVLVDGSRSRGQVWAWKVEPTAKLLDLNDGRMVFVAPANGLYTLTLTVQSAAGGRFSSATATHPIAVGVAPPVPPGPVPPSPTPPVPPAPPAPGSLADAARANAMQLPAAGRAAQAKVVAEVYRAVAAKIAAGVMSTTVEVQADTLEQMQIRLGADRRAWQPWLVEMGKVTTKLLPAGAAIDKVREAWEQIAAGLDGVT